MATSRLLNSGDVGDWVTNAVDALIDDLAANIPRHRRQNVGIHVEVSRDFLTLTHRVRLMWGDVQDTTLTMACEIALPDEVTDKSGCRRFLMKEMQGMLQELTVRGELFFMRMHRLFPNRIRKVGYIGDGQIEVEFKNGHKLVTDDDHIDTQEFLAACAMVFDL